MNTTSPTPGRIVVIAGVLAVVLRPAAVLLAGVRRPDPAQAAGLPRAGRLHRRGDARRPGRRPHGGRHDRQGRRARSSSRSGNQTLTTIELDSRYAPLRSDARAILRQKTLLGETYVELTTGSTDAPAAEGGRAPGRRRRSRRRSSSTSCCGSSTSRRARRSASGRRASRRPAPAAGATSTTRSATCQPFTENAQDVVDVLNTRRGGAAQPRPQRRAHVRGDHARRGGAGDARAAQLRAVRRARPSAATRWRTRSASCRRSSTSPSSTLARRADVLAEHRAAAARPRPGARRPAADARLAARPRARPREPLRQRRPADRRRRRRACPRCRARCAASTRRSPSAGPFLRQLNPFLSFLELNQVQARGLLRRAAGGARRHPLDACPAARATATSLPQMIVAGDADAAGADAHAPTTAATPTRRRTRGPTRRAQILPSFDCAQHRREGADEHAGLQGRRARMPFGGDTQYFPQVREGGHRRHAAVTAVRASGSSATSSGSSSRAWRACRARARSSTRRELFAEPGGGGAVAAVQLRAPGGRGGLPDGARDGRRRRAGGRASCASATA